MWWRVASFFLAVQALFCIFVAMSYGFSEPPPFAKYGRYFLLGVVAVGVFKIVRAIWKDRPDYPVRHALALDWTTYRQFAGAVALLWIQWVLLTWAKAMLPLPAGMWADTVIADFERSLLGADAFTLFPVAGNWLTALYHMWAPTIIFTFCWRFYHYDRNREASLLSIFLIVGALGTIGQYLLPSGGPIFFERLGLGDRFAADWPHVAVRASDHLWQAYEGEYISFATGISAFPSIHVATSVWLALAVGKRWAWAYPAVIWYGSVTTGWHYAIDGFAAGVGALALHFAAMQLLKGRAHERKSIGTVHHGGGTIDPGNQLAKRTH